MYWATVLYFTKSYEANLLFKIMAMVKKNWEYYGKLYKFQSSRTYKFRIRFLKKVFVLKTNLFCSSSKQIYSSDKTK